MEEKKLVPKLRFPGFTEPWEQRKLADVANIVMGQSPSSQNYTDNPNDDILVQGNADLIDGQVVPRLWTKEITKSIDEGNIVMTVRAPVGDVAKTAYKVVLGRGVAGIKGDEYIYQFLLKLKYNHYWRSLSSGSTFESINSNDIKNLIIDIPCDEERTKIGNLLSTTDTLITLHQRKLEHLKLKKKSLLQKLFPKEGEVYPELRFPGFTDPWEQRKFRSLFQKNLERNDGQFPFNKTISISRMIYSESGNGASTESLDNYKVLRVGDIAFEGHENKDFKFGRFVMNDVGNGIMSPRFTVLRPLIDMELNFWKEYINYEPIMQKKLVYSTKKGTMMNELVVEDFLNQYVAVPSVQEQQKIGYLLKCMTDDITLHQRKLEHLQLLKKALLQQLFV